MKDFNYDLLIGLLEEYSEMLKIEKVERDKKNSGVKSLRKSDDEVKETFPKPLILWYNYKYQRVGGILWTSIKL